MKRWIHVFMIMTMIVMLSGCFSIPIGDGVLEISTDGIDFVGKDEEKEMDQTESEEVDVFAEEEEDATTDEITEETANQETNDDEKTTNNCEEQDLSAITDSLMEGFFIPDCAALMSVSKTTNSLDADLSVEGDWQAVYNGYKEYFSDKLISESQNPSEKSGDLQATLYDDEQAYTYIQVSQSEDTVSLRVLQYFPSNE